MRRLLFIALVILTALGIDARQLSPSEALNRVSKGNSKESSILRKNATKATPAYVATTGKTNDFYVFNREDSGFVIVSADDRLPALLGYTENGTFDENNLPSNFKQWLFGYQHQISELISRNGNVSNFYAKQDKAEIKPLLSTKWGQKAPYNSKLEIMNGIYADAGDPAAAMAQIMKFYNWPQKGTGTKSYTLYYDSEGYLADSGTPHIWSENFSNLNFEWNKMDDVYTLDSNSESIDAVATLMRASAIASQTDLDNGYANWNFWDIPTALINYFDYDKSLHYDGAAFYSVSEWENKIYNELLENRPVIYYFGWSIVNDCGGISVCDGYKDGLFHINFGDEGLNDGYFILPIMDDLHSTVNQFNYTEEHGAILGVKPNTTGASQPAPTDFSITGSLSTARSVGGLLQPSNEFSIGEWIYFQTDNGSVFQLNSASNLPVRFKYGIKAVQQNSVAPVNFITYYDTELELDRLGYGYSWYPIFINYPDGEYFVTPIVSEEGSSDYYPIRIPRGCSQGLKMVISNGTITFTQVPTEEQVKIDEYELPESLYANGSFSVTGKASSPNSFWGRIIAALFRKGSSTPIFMGTENVIAVDSERSRSFEYTGSYKNATPGDYEFAFIQVNTNTVVSERHPVSIKAYDGNYKLECKVECTAEDLNNVPMNNVPVKMNIDCVSGFFSDYIYLVLLEENPIDNRFYVKDYISKDLVELDSKSDKTISSEISISNGIPGRNYALMLREMWDNRFYDLTNPRDAIFTLGEATLEPAGPGVEYLGSLEVEFNDTTTENDVTVTITPNTNGSSTIVFSNLSVEGLVDFGEFELAGVNTVTDNEISTYNGSFKGMSLLDGAVSADVVLIGTTNGKQAELTVEMTLLDTGMPVKIVFNGVDMTGVEDIKVENTNDQVVIYDLFGRRLKNVSSPGIYIVNGKKKIVR